MEQFLNTETLIIELLLIASLVAVAVRRIRIPYTVSLVVVGLIITSQQSIKIELTSELILSLFVPPLVFEAAFHLEARRLRETFVTILVLAVPGVLLTTVIVGFIIAFGINLPITTGLVFGALISATDPVAVVALFRSLGAPKQLTVMVEGESLFNDGTSIVIFNLMLAAALPAATGAGEAGSFNLATALLNFIVVSAGGIGIGVGLGWVVSQLIARIDDYLIETTLTTALAFGAYLVAERLHVSGVLAVVGAGIICGNFGTKGMSPTTRIVLYNFWEYLAFIANSLVFLLIGLAVNITQIIEQLGSIAIAVIAVLASRVLVVYGLSWLINLRKNRIPWSYQHVLVWGGLRGAVSLALVLSLPANFANREALQVMAYGVVLFTLLGQGTTMQFLLDKLHLVRQDEVSLEYERRQGRLLALQAARERVQQLHQNGLVSPQTRDRIFNKVDENIKLESTARQELLKNNPALVEAEQENARREALRAERAMLLNLYSNGVISETIYDELVTEVDEALEKAPELEEFQELSEKIP